MQAQGPWRIVGITKDFWNTGAWQAHCYVSQDLGVGPAQHVAPKRERGAARWFDKE